MRRGSAIYNRNECYIILNILYNAPVWTQGEFMQKSGDRRSDYKTIGTYWERCRVTQKHGVKQVRVLSWKWPPQMHSWRNVTLAVTLSTTNSSWSTMGLKKFYYFKRNITFYLMKFMHALNVTIAPVSVKYYNQFGFISSLFPDTGKNHKTKYLRNNKLPPSYRRLQSNNSI